MKPGKTGLERIFHALGYSWKGMRAAFRHEVAFRQEVLLITVLFPLSFWLAATTVEWLLLTLPLLLVLVVELLNSAIESAVDRIGEEAHELAGRAKDMGSAAVFFSILMILLAWVPLAWTRLHG